MDTIYYIHGQLESKILFSVRKRVLERKKRLEEKDQV